MQYWNYPVNEINLEHSFPCYGLWHLMTLSALFQLYRGSQFYWWWKPKYPEKTTNLSQVTDKIYHIMLYRVPHHELDSNSQRGNRHQLHR